MTEPTTDEQFTAEMVTGDMTAALHPFLGTSQRVHRIGDNGDVSVFSYAEIVAAAFNASPLWAEYKRLRAENEALRRERDQAVQSYAADRERFVSQEERHRVKITEQAERIREIEKLVERGIDEGGCACAEEAYFCEGFVKCWYCAAKELLTKHRRAGE